MKHIAEGLDGPLLVRLLSNHVHFRKDVPLSSFSTMQLGGKAEVFAETDCDGFAEVLGNAKAKKLRPHLIGGGSNLLIPDGTVPGLTVLLRPAELLVREVGEFVTVNADAPWDAFVEWTVRNDFAGVECLSGIPGLVGAAPIQNIGAFGQEVSETISSVATVDQAGQTLILTAADCGFQYRDSQLKQLRSHERPWVTAVTFRLRKRGTPTRSFAELARALPPEATLTEAREQILAIRKSRSMVLAPHGDPADPNRASVGSFFVNPIVSSDQAAYVQEQVEVSMPHWPTADNRVKLAAAWLIEQSGLHKGHRFGNFGLSSHHTLAVVHHGGGSFTELMAFQEAIESAVERRFRVRLEREPRILGEDS